MKRLLRLIPVILILALPIRFAIAGGAQAGNGTDYLTPDEGAAWFLGLDRTIKVCYESAPHFGTLSSADLELVISQAFNSWKTYIDSKGINSTSQAMLGPEKIAFPTRSEIHQTCNGSEDLRIYFGVKKSEVSKSLDEFNSPFAFAQRTSYDSKTGWGSGFIYVAPQGAVDPAQSLPNWSTPNTLLAILTHEIGHTYGCGHVTGTVMDANLAQKLSYFSNRLDQIDIHRSLWAGLKIGAKYNGTLISDAGQFETLMGRAPTGTVHADLSETSLLTVSDDIGSTKFRMSFDTNMRAVGAGDNLVFSAYLNKGSPAHFGLRSNAVVYYGSLKTAKGQILNVMYESNTAQTVGTGVKYGPVTIKYFDQGTPRVLFQTQWN
jgi:hypothetical protein